MKVPKAPNANGRMMAVVSDGHGDGEHCGSETLESFPKACPMMVGPVCGCRRYRYGLDEGNVQVREFTMGWFRWLLTRRQGV